MRTTLTVDDDVLAAARELAEQQRRSIGDVISELSRKGLQSGRAERRCNSRVPTFAPRRGAAPITMYSVREALDEE